MPAAAEPRADAANHRHARQRVTQASHEGQRTQTGYQVRPINNSAGGIEVRGVVWLEEGVRGCAWR